MERKEIRMENADFIIQYLAQEIAGKDITIASLAAELNETRQELEEIKSQNHRLSKEISEEKDDSEGGKSHEHVS